MSICWHEERRGADRSAHEKVCPAKDAILARWGRCRSGKRWFWYSVALMWRYDEENIERYGWADTEDEAVDAAKTAVVEMVAGRDAIAGAAHGWASHTLRELNAEKRKARPFTGGDDPGVVEYLYGEWWDNEDCEYHPVRYRVTRKTKTRIYFLRDGWRNDERERFVDRAALERDGKADRKSAHWWDPDGRIYLSPPVHERPRPVDVSADVARLRQAAAEAHPDRGGTAEEFREAYAAYAAAKSRLMRVLEEVA